MKSIVFICLFIFQNAFAQTIDYTDVKEISRMERSKWHSGSQERTGHQRSSQASDNFDVKYYRCEWTIDPSVRFIEGKVTVYFTTSIATNSISFDLANALTTDSVIHRGQKIGFVRPLEELKLNFGETISSGQLDSVSIFYKGVPPSTGFGSFIMDTHSGTPVAWSLSEPYGSKDWWPCKTNLGDKADSIDVFITHPSIYKAASNGLLQSETVVSATQTTTHWKHRYPIASYLVCFAVTNYAVFNNTVQLGAVLLPMQTYCYPENKELFQIHTPKVLEAMQLFHKYFGDYPFIKEKYGHVQFGWGGGMEHQTATFIITPDESLMAHELGHQWFGDKITANSWEDIWLHEGFATYLAAFHMENKYPATKIQNRKNLIDNITSEIGGSLRVKDTTNLNLIFNGRLSYNKGAAVVRMLQFLLGDDVFFKGVKSYLQDPKLAYGSVKTADLKKHLEQASGKNLTKFFDQWFEKEGYPSYEVEWSQIGTTVVKIKVSQTTSHPSVTFFEMPLPLIFKKGNQEKKITVNPNVNGQEFFESIGFVAESISIDPDYWLISKNNTSKKLSINNSGKSVMEIYPNPSNSPMTVYLHDFNEKDAQLEVFNMAGQKLYTKKVNFVNGAEYFSLPINLWPAGVYVVRLIAGKTVLTQQIVKQD